MLLESWAPQIELSRRPRPDVQEPLQQIAAQGLQPVGLFRGFHPFRDHLEPQTAGKRDHCLDQRVQFQSAVWCLSCRLWVAEINKKITFPMAWLQRIKRLRQKALSLIVVRRLERNAYFRGAIRCSGLAY